MGHHQSKCKKGRTFIDFFLTDDSSFWNRNKFFAVLLCINEYWFTGLRFQEPVHYYERFGLALFFFVFNLESRILRNNVSDYTTLCWRRERHVNDSNTFKVFEPTHL